MRRTSNQIRVASSIRPLPKLGALGITLLGILMAGCAQDVKPAAPVKVEPKPTRVERELTKATDNIAYSLRILAETHNAMTVDAMTPAQASQVAWQSRYVPPGMEHRITIRWDGPPESVIRMCAATSGYKFHVRGRRPIQTPVVRIRAKSERVVNVLRDIGTQLDREGKVRIIPQNRTIELIYGSAS